MINLIDKFLEHNASNLAAPSCIYEGRVVTRGAFLRAVCDFTRALNQRGVKPGDVVGLSLGQHPGHLALMLALARLGAISLPVHPRSEPRARLALLRRYGATRVIVQSQPPREAGVASPPVPEGLDVISLADLQAKEGTPHQVNLDLRGMLDFWPSAESLARISLTSGTTGEPNAVCYDQAYWVNRIATTVENCDSNTRLMSGNLSLTMGSISAFAAIFAGGVAVFYKQHDLQAYIQTVNLYGLTHAMMAPAMIKRIAARLPKGVAFPSLQYLRIVGGGLSAHLVDLATTRLTPNVYLPYGISEVGAISMATPQDLALHPEYAGKAKPGTLIEVVDALERTLPAGEVGEFRVKLPVMLAGYHLNEARTQEKFRDGWFYTNDIGVLTVDGYVRIDGRKDDRINLGGAKFYPDRVERVLDVHSEVSEVSVFASKVRGEFTLVAAVVWRDQADVASLLAFCKTQGLPAGMVPQVVLSVLELPRNEAGKVVRSELAVLLQAQLTQLDKTGPSAKPVLH